MFFKNVKDFFMDDILTVRTERTPNPNSLKYNLGRILLPGGSANFPTKESAERSPLAKRLFLVEGVVSVFLGSDFITLTKGAEVLWEDINASVAPCLEDFFESGDAVLNGEDPVKEQLIGAESEDPKVLEKLSDIIDERVRPAVAQDGGDIVFRGFLEGVVFLEMKGACSGCPSATITLKEGVENMLKHYLPEVKEVRAL